ncbi:hypothetical protein [Streptomyces massasporeus]|uniref:hypothetical protein n=1 Tax=Streptomyces massasporeus TaxID=67324 RepID=UPI0033E16151
MGATGTNVGPEPDGDDGSRWKLALIPEFASVALALAALVVSIIAMVWQTDTAQEQTRLTAEQKELAEDQRDLEQDRATEESLPKVRSWLLPSAEGSRSAYLYIINKDKDALTWLYIKVRDQLVSLRFVPPCTRTILPLSPEEVEVFASDAGGWSVYFQSADAWWTFDHALRVVRGDRPIGEAASLNWGAARFYSEPDCET